MALHGVLVRLADGNGGDATLGPEGRAGSVEVRLEALDSASPDTGAADPELTERNARRAAAGERAVAYKRVLTVAP